MSGFKLALTNNVLIALAGGAVLIALIVLLALPLGGNAREGNWLATLSVPVTLTPDWEERPTATPPSGKGELVVYLDVSHSMGGFIPPPGVETPTAGLSTAAQLLPGYLVSGFGARPTRWKSVAQGVDEFASSPSFERSLFVGSQTLLEPAIEEGLNNLDSGRFAAVVLVTDLVATSGPESAVAAARPLISWFSGTAVKSEAFDLGLLGVRATYWGVHSSTCSQRSSLGCWYSEHANRYLPLTEPVQRPFYLIVLGRSDGPPSAVDRLGTRIAAELQEIGLETSWELLSAGARSRSARLNCEVGRQDEQGKQPQHALWRREDGTVSCQRNDIVILDCSLVNVEAAATGTFPLSGRRSNWPAVEVQNREGRLSAFIDCAQLRREPPEDPLRFVDLEAAPTAQPADDRWTDWSAVSDESASDLKGTLQLHLFLDQLRLRPERYQVTLGEPILEMRTDDR